jgi:hypothetical protein
MFIYLVALEGANFDTHHNEKNLKPSSNHGIIIKTFWASALLGLSEACLSEMAHIPSIHPVFT